MKWVTKAYVHLDRVVCPWLILRFIDPAAQFAFVDWDDTAPLPPDAIPFAIEGAELGPHDADGTTFEKLLRKYDLQDPALDKMAAIVASGVQASLQQGQPDGAPLPRAEGAGLMAISRGMMLLEPDDHEAIRRALVIYDALYLYCQAELAVEADPSLPRQPLPARTEHLRQQVAHARRRLSRSDGS